MEMLHEVVAGIDVHKDTVVASVRDARGTTVKRETRTFGTTTADLIQLFDWMAEAGCDYVAMESTGVYWKPVWRVLEGGFDLVLANAQEVKNVPGRKSDVSDAQWLSDLAAHGLIRASFVPDELIQDLRDLTRTRKQMIRETVQHKQRLQKVLERCNIKLASVISDVTGMTGRAVLQALIAGERDPVKLADLAQTRIKQTKWLELAKSVKGYVRAHDKFMLDLHLRTLDALDEQIDRLGARIQEVMPVPFHDAARRLSTIPGVGPRVAETIIAEIGTNMSIFRTADHVISWAGLCPRMDSTAGKRRSTRIRMGAPWLKPVLVQAAWAAVRKKDTYLMAFFHRLRSRRGPKKAIIAVAAKLLLAAYHILRDDTDYRDLGARYLDDLDKARTTQRLVRRLAHLGYDVALTPAAA